MDLSKYPPPEKVNMASIARALDVSVRLVSQALDNRESTVRVGPETAKKIQKLAEHWNFRINSNAKALRRQKHGNIGYLEFNRCVGEVRPAIMEEGVCREADARNLNILYVRHFTEGDDRTPGIPKLLRESQIDSLILVNAWLAPRAVADAISRSHLPVVHLNTRKRYNAVYADDEMAGRMVVQNLQGKGTKRIAFVHTGNGAQGAENLLRRFEGCRRGAARVEVEEWEIPSLADPVAVRKGLSRKRGVQAVVCATEACVLAVQRVMLEKELRAPDDLILAGFEEGGLSAAMGFASVAVRIPYYEMGKAAVSMAAAQAAQKTPRRISAQVLAPEWARA